jgi:hypothetical protein
MSACLIAAAFSGVQSSSCPNSNPALMFFCLFLLVALSFATAHLLRENNFEEEEEEDPLADALDENEVDATVVGKSNVRSILLCNIFFYSLLFVMDDKKVRDDKLSKNRVE